MIQNGQYILLTKENREKVKAFLNQNSKFKDRDFSFDSFDDYYGLSQSGIPNIKGEYNISNNDKIITLPNKIQELW